MSDTSQGDGWWQASNGKWYPPDQQPGTSSSGASPASAAPQLDVGLALSYGWAKFTENLGSMIAIVAIYFGVTLVFNLVGNFVRLGNGISTLFFSFALVAVGVFVSMVVEAGLIRAALAVTAGERPEPAMMFSTERIAPYIIASLLVALLSFVGLLACCIGFVVVRIFVLFYGFYVLDPKRHLEPADSIKKSFDLVSGNAGSVVLFAIVVTVVNLLTCGLAIGVTEISIGYAYRQLNGEPVV
ncbi:MAG: hypothetical protein F2520_03655 [Actinobacteria bacterium]|uniref:Unannotated protein n=1 Tax=freshwater metagenome TaxID=449393 RepID=A0A6J7L5N2_9ZZZZ|nr:hypothetical protein [Actinomycetota bacterium]MTA77339.1 hypothetical protein [Actinomycetota bacterium]